MPATALPGAGVGSREREAQNSRVGDRDRRLADRTIQFAGMVMMGACGAMPVSAIDENIMRNVNARLE